MPTINIRQRDRQTLWLLSCTQASAALILKAAEAFELPEDEEPYRDERRVRERLQALMAAGLVRSSMMAVSTGGVANWYRLTNAGFRTVYGDQQPLPSKAFFEPIKVSLQDHTLRLAEAIVQTLVAAHVGRIRIGEFRRENELEIVGGNRKQFPDAFFRLHRSGRQFNCMFELDNGTEPLDSHEPHSIREKILGYEAHQDAALGWWRQHGQPRRVNPRFRVVFLTRSAQRAEHIVGLAGQLARNKDRLLCYATTLDDYLAERDALRNLLFLDHRGHWQSLVNTHPKSHATRTPIRLGVA